MTWRALLDDPYKHHRAVGRYGSFMRKDISGLSMKPGDGIVKMGEAVQLNLFSQDGRGGTELIPGNMAAWSSSDDQIGEVNRQGRLTPRGAGSVSITARYAENKVTAVFTVVD